VGKVELLHNFVSMNSLFSLIPRPKIGPGNEATDYSLLPSNTICCYMMVLLTLRGNGKGAGGERGKGRQGGEAC